MLIRVLRHACTLLHYTAKNTYFLSLYYSVGFSNFLVFDVLQTACLAPCFRYSTDQCVSDESVNKYSVIDNCSTLLINDVWMLQLSLTFDSVLRNN